MKSLFSKLLPFFFLAMLSLAPLNAQAAASPGDGTFDCLGNLDWGCRVIGFIFQTTDNDVTYVKDGATVVEQPTPVMTALRAMMGFFSNALLILASVKLLYELIQMTAESAQTGQVGGKDTNKLWAPIRLVFAIGLLVPLASSGGLNSGQFIVLQVAKWGSGLASQGWKIFVKNLSSNEALTKPNAPRIKSLAMNTVKSYACKAFINYYAEKLGLPNDVVSSQTQTIDNTNKLVFGNKVYNSVCGYVRYKVPLQTYSNTKDDARISRELSKSNYDAYVDISPELGIEAKSMAQYYLPDGRDMPKPSSENVEALIKQYQKKVTDNIETGNNYAKAAMDKITEQIQAAADTEGWTSAGTWFLAITRAQGQLINGAANIPEASGPEENSFKNYGAAYDAYKRFVADLEQGTRPQDTHAVPTAGGPAAGLSVTSEASSWLDFMKIWTTVAEAPADGLFWFLDKAAAAVGLWDSDPKKAFGDLGSSTNPFGEIAALGHKKIRLGLNFIGYAMVTTVGGSVVSTVGSVTGSPVAKIAGAGIAALSALLMMIATLFLLAGVLLAYIVPMFPFTRFFFSILTWLGTLIEAMVLVPFMSLAFLTPKGEGFTGPNTRNAIFLIFQLFMRPILCLFGLICAMIMFYIAAKFLNASFYEATSGVGDYEGSGMRFMQKLVYSVMYVGLIYSAANISFKMIEHIPKHAMRWMGGSASEESYDDHDKFMGVAAAVGGGQMIQQLNALPQNIAGSLTNSLKHYGDGVESRRNSASATTASDARDNRLVNSLANAINGPRNNGGPPSTPPTPTPTPGPGPGPLPGGSGAAQALGSELDDPQQRLASAQTALQQTGAGSGSNTGSADGESIASESTQPYNQGIAANAGANTGANATRAIPAATNRQISGQPSIERAMSRIISQFGNLSGRRADHVRATVSSEINNGRTVDDAVAIGVQAARDFQET